MLEKIAYNIIEQAKVQLSQFNRRLCRTMDKAGNRILHKELEGSVRQGRRSPDGSEMKQKWSEDRKKGIRKIMHSEARERK